MKLHPALTIALGLTVAAATALVVTHGAAAALPAWGLTALLEGATVALAWSAALGYGRLAERLLRGRSPDAPDPLAPARAHFAARLALRAGTGWAALMTLCHLAGLCGLVHPAAFGLIAAAGLAGALDREELRAGASRLREFLSHPAVLLAAPLAAILFLAASMPPGLLWPREAAGYDALEYHLQVPREWLAFGAIRPLRHNAYSFLPLNLENVSLALMSLRGGAFEAMLAVQWLHASFALATALLAGAWIGARSDSRAAGWVAGLMILAPPWTLVTGSLAYNECATAFLILSAWVLVWEAGLTRRVMAAAGAIAGAAAGTKLTAAGFGILPLVVAWVAFRDRDEGPRRSCGLVTAALVFAAAAAAMHAPYIARNTLWTGNPAFPLATRALGRAHWSEAEEWRWMDAHRPKAPPGARLALLWKSGPADPGFGAPWWCAAALGLAFAFRTRSSRPLAAGAAAFAAMQVLFWIAATHLQPRFLHPLVVPLAAAAGLGAASLAAAGARFPWILAVLLAIPPAAWQGKMLHDATRQPGMPGVEESLRNPWVFADLVEGPALKGRKVLLVAEARAFYYPEGTIYSTPFETGLWARLWREERDPARMLQRLRDLRITLVVVDWNEAERLKATYGLDPEISRAHVAALVRAGARERTEGAPPGMTWLEIPVP
ncbi:MAG: hypothetical protein HYY18_12310 [Planctomycetes bacterium]|nr:hypothetical protein [Planctomycetota bacterium]